jgi:hypothetical protein
MKENFKELLPFYVLGVLTEAEEAELAATIATNAPVQTELEALHYVVAALAYYPSPITPPPQLKQALFARISSEPLDRAAALSSTQPVRPAPAQRWRNFWQQLFRQPLVPVLAGLSLIIILLAGLWISFLQRQTMQLQGALVAVQDELASLRAENEALQGGLASQYEQLADQVAVQAQENERLKAELDNQSQQLAALSDELVEFPAAKQVLINLAQNQAVQENNLAALSTEIAALRNQNVVLAREILAQRTVMAHATSPDVRVMALSGTDALPEAHGQLFANPFDETAALVVYGLPPLQPGLVYKFWLVAGDQPQEAGVIQVDADGLGMLVVTSAAAIGTYNGMGVSIEPASNTNQPPENDMIMVGNFSS